MKTIFDIFFKQEIRVKRKKTFPVWPTVIDLMRENIEKMLRMHSQRSKVFSICANCTVAFAFTYKFVCKLLARKKNEEKNQRCETVIILFPSFSLRCVMWDDVIFFSFGENHLWVQNIMCCWRNQREPHLFGKICFASISVQIRVISFPCAFAFSNCDRRCH